ncbi:MAG: carboxypeptidase-like regulatory domain-containing protein, partial [Bacteroidetes bacterium]|nr:carboxypeptidase-like regulatory domain-containing protein [Bacteroidota bacterium]
MKKVFLYSTILITFNFYHLTFFTTSNLHSQQIFTISGRVVDSETSQPLPAASIRIDGTMKGTITTADGTFRLSLAAEEYRIIFSFVGYQTDSQKVVLDQDVILRIQLKPVGVQLPEVVTIAEDPAIEIIRKAISNKRQWMDKLNT